jgi:hypothetical protein
MTSMRILFVMHYPGYLRYFDSTVRLLAERGHAVHLAFTQPGKQSEGLEALATAGERVTVLGSVPARQDRWDKVAREVRRTTDYARYLHPDFREASYLRNRMERRLPRVAGCLAHIRTLPAHQLRLLLACLQTMERAIPSSQTVEAFISSAAPDIVLVSPLVGAAVQTDLVKSARALGIPAAVPVASWDHLTTKGLMRIQPDLVIVWNDIQRAEAAEFHGVPPENVAVTGAQPFDRWFQREPSTSREAFCRKVGLPPDRPCVLFVGSTASISAHDAERNFVRQWVQAIRDSQSPVVRDLAVLVRPHPYNFGEWASADLSDLGHVAIWPRDGANPVNEDDRADYFDSMHHSVAIVGINTSAMIEAAIVGRPVLTILASEFTDTQEGTLHFRYLLPEEGGFLRVAATLQEHLDQLAETIARPELVQDQLTRFLRTFVRPNGVDQACTPLVVEVIERLGSLGHQRPERLPLMLYPLRCLLRLAAAGFTFTEKARRGRLRLAAWRTSRSCRKRPRAVGEARRRDEAAL